MYKANLDSMHLESDPKFTDAKKGLLLGVHY